MPTAGQQEKETVPLLTLAVTPADDHVVVRVSGEADLSTRPQLVRGLQQAAAAGDPVVVDLASVRFFDSSCLGALGCFSADLAARGRTVRLTGVPRRTLRLIDLAGLTDLLPAA
jgi:anti-anti-sigma factor